MIYTSIIEPLTSKGIRTSMAMPQVNANKQMNTAPLFIGSGNFLGNELMASGIFLSGGTFQGPSPFKGTVPKNFQNNIEQQTFTHVVSSESEKDSLISDLADVSGHYGSIEGSASLSFASEISVAQTSLDVFKYAYISLGSMVFDFSKQELSDNVNSLLDSTLDQNKNPDTYLANVEKFLSTYGYYYTSSYQLYGELLASWQITTMSKKDKQEISAEISGKVTGGALDFSAVNKFISTVSSSFSESSSTYHAISIGVNKNVETIDQLNDVFNNLLSSIDQTTAKISKIFISPWTSLSQIAVHISKIQDQQLQKKVVSLLNGPNLTQDIWDRILLLQNGMLSLRDRMRKTVDDPYTYDFWGFLTSYETLPLDKIKSMIEKINGLLDELSKIDEKNYASSFFDFQKTKLPVWEQIQKDYMNLTLTPKYIFYVQTGYFDGNVTGALSGYNIIQGETKTGGFDPSLTQVNSSIYVGPSLQRPYFFATAWQQGVINFNQVTQSDKRKNPFSIELECRLAWTSHLGWDIKKETIFFPPHETKVMGFAVYDTTLVEAPLRGIIGVALTQEN